jgi:hypothetical protein
MTDLTGSAPAGTPAASPAAGSNGGAPAAWFDAISDQDLRGFAQGRGWKDPGAVVESYRNLEKLTGVPADQLLRLPKEDDADGWKSVWGRLGRPETADGYQLPVPDGMPGEFAKAASAKFHELGIPAKQAQALASWWNESQSAAMQQQETARTQQSEADLAALRSEWGNNYDAEVEKGKRAARQFGFDIETLEKMEGAVGTAGLLKMMSKIGNALGEAKFEGADAPSKPAFGMGKDGAVARINELKADQAWTSRYLSGDIQAKAEMDRLMQIAYG